MNYGGFWIRFLAYVIDSAIVTIGFVASCSCSAMMGLELAGAEIIFLVLSILYWALMQSSKRQATLGKALCGLKVGGPNGERISVPRALGREAAKIISSLTLLIGYVIAAFTRNKQALHDFVATTYVVRDEPGRVVAAVGAGLARALLRRCIAGMSVRRRDADGFTIGPMAAMIGEQAAMQKPAARRPSRRAGSGHPTPKAVAARRKPAAEAPKHAARGCQAAPAHAAPVQCQSTAPPRPRNRRSQRLPRSRPGGASPRPRRAGEGGRARGARGESRRSGSRRPSIAPAVEGGARIRRADRTVAGPVVESKIRFNDLVTAVLYRDAGAVNDLLAFGKWPDKADSTGMTPLMIAASIGEAEIAEALLKAGADPRRAGPGGQTAISIARERKDAAHARPTSGKR